MNKSFKDTFSFLIWGNFIKIKWNFKELFCKTEVRGGGVCPNVIQRDLKTSILLLKFVLPDVLLVDDTFFLICSLEQTFLC